MNLLFRLALGALACSTAISHAFAAESPIYPSLQGDLVSMQGGKVKKFNEAPLAKVRYFAIYYSAEWCPPCRAFTPDLVKWYQREKPKNPQFELVFVSSDHSEEEMEKYITGDKMPWPALAFPKKKGNRTLTQYSGRGIPCLVLVDAQGKVLSHSYEGETYVGPRKVLQDIEKTLKANPATADELAAAPGGPAAGTATTTSNGSSFSSVGATTGKPAGSASFDEFFKKKPAQ